ncbi:MAG: hypothetical protein AB8G05_27520 [Oligoflexales bacterium]
MNYKDNPVGVWLEIEEKHPNLTNKKILDEFNTYEFTSADLIKKIRRINNLNNEIKQFLISNQENIRWSHLTSVLRSKGEFLEKIGLKEFKIVSNILDVVKLEKKSIEQEKVFNKYSSEVMTGTSNESVSSNICYFPGVSPGDEIVSEGTVPESGPEGKILSPLTIKGDRGDKLVPEPVLEDKEECQKLIIPDPVPESGPKPVSGTVPYVPSSPSQKNVFNKYSYEYNISSKNEARKIETEDFILWSIKVLLLACVCVLASYTLTYTSSKVYSGGDDLKVIGWLQAGIIDCCPFLIMLFPTKGFGKFLKACFIIGVFVFAGFTFYSNYETGTANIKSYVENPKYKRLKERREEYVKQRDEYPKNHITKRAKAQAKIDKFDTDLTKLEDSSSSTKLAHAGETKQANIFGVQMMVMAISMCMGHFLALLVRKEEYWKHLILIATSK